MNRIFFILCIVFTEINAVLLSYSNDCPEKCEILYDPVCGSNGRTYKNNCHLARENCFGTKEEVTEVHKGECLKNEEDEAEDQKPYDCLRVGRGKYLSC